MLCEFHAYTTLPAHDLARARRFYEQVLGFEPASVSEGGVQYNANNSVIFLYPSTFAGTNQATSVALIVEGDLGEVVEDLRRKGVRFEEYDLPDVGVKTVNGIASAYGISNAWFKDTEGNIISLEKSDRPMPWPEAEVAVAAGGGFERDEDF